MAKHQVRWWFLFGGSVLSVFMGFVIGMNFMDRVLLLFDQAVAAGGNNPVALVKNLAHSVKGILGWIVFGVVMTNAVVVSSSLSLVLLLSEPNEQ